MRVNKQAYLVYKNSPSYRLELFKNFVLWIFSLFFKPSNTDQRSIFIMQDPKGLYMPELTRQKGIKK